jgi:glycosyltransferase involved in cell wall biosynthesis
MNTDSITPLILTYNESANICRVLEGLTWARRVLVVDSFSTDNTLNFARRFSNVDVIQNPFQSFAEQCNYGLSRIDTEWVLSLDADYVISLELHGEIEQLRPESSIAGFAARFRYCVYGRPLRTSLYPPRVILYRSREASYTNEGHGHKVVISGPVGRLRSFISHDDRKPIDRWLSAQTRYARVEADYLSATRPCELKRVDRLRRLIIVAPAAVVLYTLFYKRLLLDGWPGLYYVMQRAYFELLLALCLLDKRFHSLTPQPEISAKDGNFGC